MSKSVDQVRFITRVADARAEREDEEGRRAGARLCDHGDEALEKMLEEQMREAAAAMDFELAAHCAISCSRFARGATRRAKKAVAALVARRTIGVARPAHSAAGGPRTARVHARPSWSPGASASVVLANGAAGRHDRRRARRRKDDARAGDLSRLRRDGRRHQSDVRARAPLRGAEVAASFISTSIASSARTS